MFIREITRSCLRLGGDCLCQCSLEKWQLFMWLRIFFGAQDSGRERASVHAYLHCKEGDQENAAYWCARAGKTACGETLDAEWGSIVRALLHSNSQNGLMGSRVVDYLPANDRHHVLGLQNFRLGDSDWQHCESAAGLRQNRSLGPEYQTASNPRGRALIGLLFMLFLLSLSRLQLPAFLRGDSLQ